MYCGNCFRDNALVAALRQRGQSTLMVPLYLPLTLDETDQSTGTPVFFNGINVYLEQKSKFFRTAPEWLHRLLASPFLLKWAAGFAGKTQPAGLGEMTLSMVRGEEGNQSRELEELIAWLKSQSKHPDVICLSNAMLMGLARRLKEALRVPIVCMLQGEDYFLDGLADPYRDLCWETLARRAREIDLFIAPSRYFADHMSRRLRLPADTVRVVYNGINLDGWQRDSAIAPPDPPVLGYFARMCPEKGLDTLIEAYLLLKSKPATRRLKLRIGGGCGAGEKAWVKQQRRLLEKAGVMADVEFHPNLDRPAKVAFYQSLSIFSTPARYGEAFGLYMLEAMAAGVPVVQPRHAAFPELVEMTGGGVLCEPDDPASLAAGIEQLLNDPVKARAMGEAAREVTHARFNVERMADETLELFAELSDRRKPAGATPAT